MKMKKKVKRRNGIENAIGNAKGKMEQKGGKERNQGWETGMERNFE